MPQKGNITLILLIILLIAAGVTYFLITSGKISNPLSKKEATASLGEQIYTKTKNPLEDKLPETNPFSKVNPFKGVYKNPFE